jgi:hypothetical protein
MVSGSEVAFETSPTASSGEQFTVFSNVPPVVQAGRCEGVVESHPMTVSFGVGEGPVHIEDDRPQGVVRS